MLPDIFICNGWQSAMVPGIFKKHFEGINDFYVNIKTVMVVHDLNEYADISRKDLELAEVPVDDSLKGNKLNVFDVGAFQADAIIVFDKPSNVISEKLLKHRKCLQILQINLPLKWSRLCHVMTKNLKLLDQLSWCQMKKMI